MASDHIVHVSITQLQKKKMKQLALDEDTTIVSLMRKALVKMYPSIFVEGSYEAGEKGGSEKDSGVQDAHP
jgi:hypothetical protein